MGRLRRSRTHRGIRDNSRKARTRARTKDLDQIHTDMKPENKSRFEHQPVDPDQTGLGQHYCVPCARYFIDAAAMETHVQNKLHKKRVKLLKEEPYTQAEAEAAVGLSTDHSAKKTSWNAMRE